MRITQTGVTMLHESIETSSEIAETLFSTARHPEDRKQTIKSWHDEIENLAAIVDDMRGILMSELRD